MHPCLRMCEMQKCMSCSLSLVIKKKHLYPYPCRSENALSVRLGCGLGSTQDSIQHMVDEAHKAKWYYSDGLDTYSRLWYHFGRYEVSEGKSNTYSVEADNAELRHYLAHLARKSHCFSRCPPALRCAIRLFAFCFNSRQPTNNAFPNIRLTS
jgi:IS1 family transposase